MAGGDGKFYVVPTRAGCTGVSFETEREAEIVADAINAAYMDGQKDAKEEIRNALGIED